jgi:5-methyltetrahydropteroyltriglutamate--homocysteine methyltransferase
MMYAKEEGVPVDPEALAKRVREAVADVVKKQAEAGVDLINDGEMSKPSYATYVKDRLEGFGGTGNTFVYQDLAAFPKLEKRVFGDPGRSRRKTPACNAPLGVRDSKAAQVDVDNLKTALANVPSRGGFMSAASPGVVSLFFRNDYYKDFETYIYAIAEAMRHEYETIAKAGIVLQIDCPDLAMSRHTGFQDLSEAEFVKRARYHAEVLNHALGDIPPEMVRIHICWGNYEGPHTHDIDLAKIIDVILSVHAQAISLEAANPRHEHEWALWKERRLPDDKVLLPGFLDTSTNYVEHPDLVAERIIRFADVVGRERVIASTDCGFGTSAGYGKIDPEIAFLKLGALVEGAARASKRLWR